MQEQRFTIDGGEDLERHLARTCERARVGVQQIIPSRKLEGLVLGGGYGRGEGGVLQTSEGERPYNDMDFYVFVRGTSWWNQRRYGEELIELSERLSPGAGLHVELKLDSLARLRRSTVSMFSYDLVCGHRIIFGDQTLFNGCEHLRDASQTPAAEATRLLFNRCSGLLLAGEFLGQWPAPGTGLWRGERPAEFAVRNLAKARLALGDALLTALGQYHWSCLERGRLMARLDPKAAPFLPEIRRHHAAGIKFKLHPHLADLPAEMLSRELVELSGLAQKLWLWLESRRLNCEFSSARDYALDHREKCPGSPAWRNYLLNLKTFGIRGAFSAWTRRYPRERLFNALALLLWNGDSPGEHDMIEELRRLLGTKSSSRAGFVQAYSAVWPGYG